MGRLPYDAAHDCQEFSVPSHAPRRSSGHPDRTSASPRPAHRGQSPRPGGARPATAPRRPQPKATQPSELDRALDAALAAPEPAPRTFAQLGLPDALVSVLARRGIAAPFAIQTRTLPDALAGRAVHARPQTGPAKTLGFDRPMPPRLAADGARRQPMS